MDHRKSLTQGQNGKGATNGSTLSTSLFDQPPTGGIHPRQDVLSPRPSPSVPQLQSQRHDSSSTPASFTFMSGLDSPSRPSAASIREFNYSRRHSAIDFASTFNRDTPPPPPPPDQNVPSTPHRTSTTSPHKKTLPSTVIGQWEVQYLQPTAAHSLLLAQVLCLGMIATLSIRTQKNQITVLHSEILIVATPRAVRWRTRGHATY